MSTLVPFAYGDQPVRVVSIDGEPWFVLADLCRVLDLSNPSTYATRLAVIGEATRMYPIIDSLGRTQQATIVSEAGMYEVVIRSDKPQAVTFRRWITSEVLPSIRKTATMPTLARTILPCLDPSVTCKSVMQEYVNSRNVGRYKRHQAQFHSGVASRWVVTLDTYESRVFDCLRSGFIDRPDLIAEAARQVEHLWPTSDELGVPWAPEAVAHRPVTAEGFDVDPFAVA